jgi:hypothetical protein
MISMAIPNRPFASEPFTGLMLPDGIFEVSIGMQRINVHFKNIGSSSLAGVQVYLESVSDPGIIVTPQTHFVGAVQSGIAVLKGWMADFSGATPGAHRVSFIVEGPAGRMRIIKKIFVTKISFNAAAGTFSAQTPEGVLELGILDMIRPKDRGCCKKGERQNANDDQQKPSNVLDFLKRLSSAKDPDFEFCPPGYLFQQVEIGIMPTPPFAGQYGDLPFQDPWWKIILCILAALLLIASAIAQASGGSGSITVTAGGGAGGAPDCCGIRASGGGSSYVAAGLAAAAAAVATVAGLSDARDPVRRGQDKTIPTQGELTVGEKLVVEFKYIEPVAIGRPFAVGVAWEYTRVTTGQSYTYSVNEVNTNIHVSTYKITAPDVVLTYKKQPFIVKATFENADGKPFMGESLFVQCFLVGPTGQWRSFTLEDHGLQPDEKPLDGIYTGSTYFVGERDRGLWKYFVIAQDVNTAQPDMKPEDAAQIIGGMVLTHQLTIGFEGGTCDFVPDGHVNVI